MLLTHHSKLRSRFAERHAVFPSYQGCLAWPSLILLKPTRLVSAGPFPVLPPSPGPRSAGLPHRVVLPTLRAVPRGEGALVEDGAAVTFIRHSNYFRAVSGPRTDLVALFRVRGAPLPELDSASTPAEEFCTMRHIASSQQPGLPSIVICRPMTRGGRP